MKALLAWSVAAAAFCLTVPARASSVELTPAGSDLGRVAADAVAGGLTVTVDAGGDTLDGSYVIVRFQNNQPLMLGADGLWSAWDGNDADLADSGFCADATGRLIFPVLAPATTGMFWPAAFTIAYRSADGMKSGTLIVDEPAP